MIKVTRLHWRFVGKRLTDAAQRQAAQEIANLLFEKNIQAVVTVE